MGWFDEQIRQRKHNDDDVFEGAFYDIAGAVMGKRLSEAMNESEISSSATEEILKYFKCKMKKDDVPKSLASSEEILDYRLRPFGIAHRDIVLEKEWYKCAVGPLLGTLKEDGSAIALIPGKISGYTYYDYKKGKRVKVNGSTEKLIDREATYFYRPLPLKKLSIKDLFIFLKNQLSFSDIVMYVVMMGITTIMGLLSPYFTKWLFGNVIESESVRMLAALAIFMTSYSLSRLLVGAYQSLINSRVTIKEDIAVQAAVMLRMLSLPPDFFRNYSSGELSQRSSYVQSLCITLMQTVLGTGLSSLFSLIYIGQISWLAPSLALPAIIITLVTIAFSVTTTMVQMKVTKEQMLASSKESGVSFAMIRGIQKIKLAGAEKRMFSRWAKSYAEGAKLTYNPPLFIKLSSTINMFITLLGTFVMYYIAASNVISVADYYAFNTSYGMVSGAFSSLASVALVIANIKPTLDMAKPILEAEPENSDGKEIVTSIHGSIELNGVYFRYNENMPYVVDNMSLKINPGEYVAIVGKTGCGKSTLVRLLLGFEKAQKGAVYYDKRDINTLDLSMLRRKIGVVTQNGKLFSGDIYSNIVISAPQLTLDEAWKAAETAAIADDIRKMPMGMNTIISEGQGGISGGQKQRLMIARAVAPNPRVLIFDEATSALDNITQKHISDAIDSLKCTRIVIAHRLSTIRHADRILVLDGGKIIESGNYDELIEKNGFFAELVERQRIDK